MGMGMGVVLVPVGGGPPYLTTGRAVSSGSGSGTGAAVVGAGLGSGSAAIVLVGLGAGGCTMIVVGGDGGAPELELQPATQDASPGVDTAAQAPAVADMNVTKSDLRKRASRMWNLESPALRVARREPLRGRDDRSPDVPLPTSRMRDYE
jgi:hypothetical protein